MVLVGTMTALVFLPLPVPSPAPDPGLAPERPDVRAAATEGDALRVFPSAVVTTDLLNIRESASDTSTILGSLPPGQRVTIVGEPVDGFVPVPYGAGRAWLAAAFLAPDETMVGGERWIDVDRHTATVTLHEGSRVVATFPGTLGGDRSHDGFYATAPGTFHVYSMTNALTATPFAEDGYITDWVGFDPQRHNGFHSPVRDESGAEKPVQAPVTQGCVRLSAENAARVFAFSSIGMRVQIHD